MTPGGGETGKVLVHPNHSNHLYVSNPLNPGNLVRRSTDGGQSWTTIFNSTDFEDEDYALAYSVQKSFVMDPTNPSRLLIGTTKVLETTNADGPSPTWSDFSPVLSTSSDVSDQYITALAISADGQHVFAATADGHVWIKRPSQFWTQTDDGLFGVGGKVVEFRIDPTNPLRAYAVTNAGGGNNIWFLQREKNISTWVNISGDFPTNLRTATIFVDWQHSPDALYVGTSRGVYHSVNFGQNWTKFGQFMPNTVVTDLQFDPAHEILAAGTYGRGAWEILIAPSTISGQVYWDLNGNEVNDAGDTGLPSALVYLDVNGNAGLDYFERSVYSGPNGNYVLDNIAPGTYDLRQIPPSGFVQTTPSYTNLTVNGSTMTGKDFGDVQRILQLNVAAKLVYLIQRLPKYEVLARLRDMRLEQGPSVPLAPPRVAAPPDPPLNPAAVDEVVTPPRRRPGDPNYVFVGDLNDLPGRLPGQPIGAMGEFEHRHPPPPPR
jgi:hypothetical protein